MIDEEKLLEDVQEAMAEASNVLKVVDGESMAVETNQVDDESIKGSEALADKEVVDSTLEVEAEAIETPEGVEKQPDVVALTQELEALKLQAEERTGQFMRIAADFENFRKRTQREKEELEQQIKCNTVVELLPVVDNFERARSQIKPQGEEAMAIHKSYQGVYKDLVDRLKRIGVAPMRSEGKDFDPNMHEAVMRESTDEFPEGTVIEELVRGYLLGERVLRHAMVKVAALPELEDDSQSGEAGMSEV